MDKLLKRQQVEELCGVSRSYLYQGIAEGWFPSPVRIGDRAVRWRESDVTRWIKERPPARTARR